VASSEPISGTSDRRRVGLVRVIKSHASSREVWQVCDIPADDRLVLKREGLPVTPLEEDTRPRVGKCLTWYSLSSGSWDPADPFVDLRLDIGLGDGVREGDRYDVHGDPITDSLNQTVTGFEAIGQCVVQPFVGQSNSLCRLDLKQWPKFTRDRALTGGYAILHRESAEY
jgi:hypothetical protein